MPLEHDGKAPYAPPSAVLTAIRGYRDGGFSGKVDKDVLLRLGVTESLTTRTLQALQQLDLIGDNYAPTPQLVAIRKAPQDEYQSILADTIRSAYAAVFEFTDPSKDGPQKVEDAFRTFAPGGQRSRMVALFLGLCEEAGIIEAKPNGARIAKPRKPVARRAVTPPVAAKRSTASRTGGGDTAGFTATGGSLPPALAGLLAQLPTAGWTQERRDAFAATFEVVLDFCIPIRDDDDIQTDEEEEVQ